MSVTNPFAENFQLEMSCKSYHLVADITRKRKKIESTGSKNNDFWLMCRFMEVSHTEKHNCWENSTNLVLEIQIIHWKRPVLRWVKNTFVMIIEKHILMIWNVSYKPSSNSPSVLVLRQLRVGVGWGVKAYTKNADVGGTGGGSKIREDLLTWYLNPHLPDWAYLAGFEICAT